MKVEKLDHVDNYTRNHLHFINKQCFEGPELPSARQFDQMLDGNDVWIVCLGQRADGWDDIIGFAVVRPKHTLGPYLWQMGIASDFRKNGAATQLLNTLIGHYKSLWLHVNTKNMAAIQLYTKQGFEVTDFARRYYGPSIHGLVMRHDGEQQS